MADRDDYWFYQSTTAPTPLAGPQGEAWWLLWGHTKDAWREGAREATKARLPLLCAPDALGVIATERNTERYPTESQQAFRVRLAESFDRWQLGGTVQGVVDAAEPTPGITSVGYYEAWQWDPSEDGTEEGWAWARFWLVLGSSWGPPPVCGEVDCGTPGLLCGVTEVAYDTVLFLRRQVRRWKAAHARCMKLLVKLGDAVICGEPDAICGDFDCGGGAVADVWSTT